MMALILSLMFLEVMSTSTVNADMKCLIMFVGYPRSAHSLVGALLDAHPNIAVAHEFDLLDQQSKRGFKSRSDLIDSIVNLSVLQANTGRMQSGYSYLVPGAWQGKAKAPLMAVGDKRGGATSMRLHADWNQTVTLMSELQRVSRTEQMKFVHVVRNPFDNIATMALLASVRWSYSTWHAQRANATFVHPWRPQFSAAVDEYLTQAAANLKFADYIASKSCILRNASIIHIDGAQLLREPDVVLEQLCQFMVVPFSRQWADASKRILFPSPFRVVTNCRGRKQ
jgi:hypothetical protein